MTDQEFWTSMLSVVWTSVIILMRINFRPLHSSLSAFFKPEVRPFKARYSEDHQSKCWIIIKRVKLPIEGVKLRG